MFDRNKLSLGPCLYSCWSRDGHSRKKAAPGFGNVGLDFFSPLRKAGAMTKEVEIYP